MVLNRRELLNKGATTLASCIRNTSCSKGWLRLLMQIIFGSITVTSFILILFMALNNSKYQHPEPQCCDINHCRIVCNEIPFYNDYEEEIINSVSEAEVHCDSIALELNRPTFEHSTLPKNWLSRMSSSVRELAIIGGNINNIAPHAFMSPFGNNLNILILEHLKINSWHTEMLVGLSNLQKLYIKNCMTGQIKKGALTPVDDTLIFLDIEASNSFDPSNITGFSDSLILKEVDFSSNKFYDILGRDSFSKLHKCKVLFLNSCYITYIGNGTFDNLHSIEVLYLNNNFLVTIPVGLFDAILPSRPRIALQDNFWYCDCSNFNLWTIFKEDLLIIMPLCHNPDAMQGLSFSDFEGYCKTKAFERNQVRSSYENKSTTIFSSGICNERNSSIYDVDQVKMVSPLDENRCLLNRIMLWKFYVPAVESLSSTKNELIKPVFRIEQNPYTMVELIGSSKPGYGLLWYKSSCHTEIYCVNIIPNVLKVFNIKSGVHYTFCPFNLSDGTIPSSQCVSLDLGEFTTNTSYYRSVIVITICISLGCLFFGAICVYILILKNPALLKANKRVLFVKHKSIEALILPPKVPLRKNEMIESENLIKRLTEKQNIFVLPDLGINSQNFIRSTSTTRSIVSNDGSYISALQPTEEQLKEWRSNQIVKQYDNGSSSDFNTSTLSSFYDRESYPYYTLHTSEEVYGVPP